MKKIVRVGTRRSRLALIQTEIIISALSRAHSELSFETVEINASGDLTADASVDYLTAKGQFSDSLEAALASGEIDIAVHSLKDLPFDSPFPIYAYGKRADPRDALILPAIENKFGGNIMADTPSPIGFSGARRNAQIAVLFPSAAVKPVRGNVITRLEKLDASEYGALVLAAAGLIRLGLERRICRYFSVDEVVPAAGQGILAVQGHPAGDYAYLTAVDDADSRRAALLERDLMTRFGGGCASPHAAYAEFAGGNATVSLMYSEGSQVAKGKVSASADKILHEAERLADELKERVCLK
ncbi:MAG: hydroxymethylbilane synthase [Clostridiaceae bacterium]|jgi:hydroxymethylbilane synthase|nr:hydroxymethylbilane synthase [Clostridiaceae bacterium]